MRAPEVLSRADRVRSLVVPVLLVLVALVQIYRVHTLDQSPWSGAGFGMFAAIDGEGARSVVATTRTEGSSAPIALPDSLQRDAFELTVVPTRDAADRLAQRWADELELDDGVELIVEVRRVVLGPGLDLSADVIVEGSSSP